jgi:predicted SnoaL-like aldol condensation-catalyzing enzyme
MSTDAVERNKDVVKRLFDAFRAGDTNAFDDLIVEEYIQHNPQAGNGLQAVKEFFAPVGPVDVEVHRVIVEGDLVAVHSHYKNGTWPASTSSASTTTGRSSSTGTCSSRCRRRPRAETTCSRS